MTDLTPSGSPHPPRGDPHEAIAALVRRAVEAFSRGDAEAFATSFSDDALVSGELALADWDEYRGRTRAADWLREAHGRWRAPTLKLVEVRARGRWTLVVVDLVGPTAAGGGAWRVYAAARPGAERLIAELHPFLDADDAEAFIRDASR
jgi:hypothetical protein